MKFFGFLSLFGAIVAALVLLTGMFTAQSAPQEAAIAALAIAIAVIPYVFFRVLQALRQADDLAAIRRLLEARPGGPGAAAAQAPQVAAPVLVAPEPAPPPPVAEVLQSGSMGVEGWTWHQLSDGSVRITDAHGSDYAYPSVAAARKAFTWWQGPGAA